MIRIFHGKFKEIQGVNSSYTSNAVQWNGVKLWIESAQNWLLCLLFRTRWIEHDRHPLETGGNFTRNIIIMMNRCSQYQIEHKLPYPFPPNKVLVSTIKSVLPLLLPGVTLQLTLLVPFCTCCSSPTTSPAMWIPCACHSIIMFSSLLTSSLLTSSSSFV